MNHQTGFIATAIALNAVETIAVFSNGAYFLGPMTFCVVSIWFLFVTSIFLNKGTLLPFSSMIVAPVLMLVALWLWTGLSLSWSITQDLTWTEFNRTGGYLAAFLLGISLSRQRSAGYVLAWLFLVVAGVGSLYALGTKVAPQILENADNLGRVSVPVGYTNALGLLVALGVPLSLYFSSVRGINVGFRILAVMLAPLLLLCLFFTLSRGAFLAMLVGLVIYFALVPLRLRSFFLLLLAGVPASLIALWSNGHEALMRDRIETGLRTLAAGQLRLYIVAAVVSIAAIFLMTLFLGKHFRMPCMAARIAGTAVLLTITVSMIVAGLLFASSKPAFADWIGQTYRDFTQVQSNREAGAARLFEIGSSGRWQLWEEAAKSWEERPLIGSGGQSFPVLHMLHRETPVFVKQPHGLPFRLLSELGIVGFFLGGAFICSSLAISMLGWSKILNRRQKGLVGTLLAVAIIYLVHTGYDWDWNIFALTMPYMFFTGILVGWSAALLKGGRRRMTYQRPRLEEWGRHLLEGYTESKQEEPGSEKSD